MIYGKYPIKDTTLYEASGSMNTGIDAILEVSHVFTGKKLYNSRPLIKFNTDTIKSELSGSNIPYDSASFYLQMTAAEFKEIPIEYTIYAFPLSGSWDNGTGRYGNKPMTTDGCSWVYRLAKTTGEIWEIPPGITQYVWDEINQIWVDFNVYWGTSSYSLYVTSSYNSVKGGGTWYYGSDFECSQSFSYEAGDIYMDVTKIVRKWIQPDAAVPNDGFIMKMSTGSENYSASLGSHKFFGTDSNTIWSPRLYIAYNDVSYVTGSLTVATKLHESELYIPFNRDYKSYSKTKIRIYCRDRYPAKTYNTGSFYMVNKALPSGSWYEIRDAQSEFAIVPYNDTFTKISCDATSSYFTLRTDTFQPDRFYKIVIKSESSGSVTVFDNNFIFKVVR